MQTFAEILQLKAEIFYFIICGPPMSNLSNERGKGKEDERNVPIITSTITTTIGISVLFKLTSNHFLYFNFFLF